jgi:phage recombination protein Bet
MQATNTAVQSVEPQATKSVSLVGKIASKFGVEPNKLWDTLKSTAFKQRNGQAPTNEQMMALLVVADQHSLNPFTKEIYAFPDQNNGIVPVVGVDGWSRIINSHAQFDGMEFRFSETTVELKGLSEPVFEWIECIMYRKDRERPTIIREYMNEIYREPFEKRGSNGPYVVKGPWQTHPRRFARHKVIIQTARVALGYTGIYDQDEAERILDEETTVVSAQPSITFESETTLAPPQEQQEMMQDLNQADFQEAQQEFEPVSQAEVVQMQQKEVETQAPKNAYISTQFGDVSAKDAKMISQMIRFTQENGSWDTTKDSFQERYDGATLDFALNELNSAFNKEFTD